MRRVSFALGAVVAILGACGGGQKSTASASAGPAPTRVKVTCPARPASVSPDSQATLTVVLKSDPPLAATADVNVRLYEETTQSNHKLDPIAPSPFTLRPGVYVLRVTTKGYNSVEGQANLTAGCEVTMNLELRGSK